MKSYSGYSNQKCTNYSCHSYNSQDSFVFTEENRDNIEQSSKEEEDFQDWEECIIEFMPRHWIHLLFAILLFLVEIYIVIHLMPKLILIGFKGIALGAILVIGGIVGIYDFFVYSTMGMSGALAYLNFGFFINWLLLVVYKNQLLVVITNQLTKLIAQINHSLF